MKRPAALFSTALLGLWAAAAAADQQAVDRGELLFRVHCRSCHGAGATGDGPMSDVLKVKPADLTLLAERAGGEFEADSVHRKIDGREETQGHGTSEMPIWGLTFRSAGLDAAQEEEVSERIRDLVAFLASLQKGKTEDVPEEP